MTTDTQTHLTEAGYDAVIALMRIRASAIAELNRALNMPHTLAEKVEIQRAIKLVKHWRVVIDPYQPHALKKESMTTSHSLNIVV